MLKFRIAGITNKLISLICTLCMVSTIVALPGIGINASAAAVDVESCITSSASPMSLWKSGDCTLTGNETSSVTVSGTSTGDMTSYPAFSFNTKTLGGGTDTIMHLGWSIDNPDMLTINLKYQDSKGKYELATWNKADWTISDKRDTAFRAKVNPASYRADFFLNLQDRTYRLYFDNILFSEATIQSGATSIKNLYFSVQAAENYTFTINDPVLVIYGEGAAMNDVVAYTLAGRNNNNCYWSVNGINTIDGVASYRLVGNPSSRNGGSGAVDGSNYIITASESNANSGVGYRLRTLKADGSNLTKACLPQDTENDNIIHQSLTITPNLTDGNSGQIGFMGKEAEYTDIYTFTETDGYVSGQAYHFDIVINNKDKKYSIFVGGAERSTGYLEDEYLSEIIYSIDESGSDTLLLSNVVTVSYDYTVSFDDVTSMLDSEENLKIRDLTVLLDENGDYEISACAVFSNISKDYGSPKLIYTLYKNGVLFTVDGKNITEEIETTNELIKVKYKDINRKYPYCLLKVDGNEVTAGDVLTVKAHFFAGGEIQADSDEVNFTVE